MKYRKLDANGDYALGTGADFYVDQPEAVAQIVKTRLLLYRGEWNLSPDDGMPWRSEVLRSLPPRAYDALVRQTILSTPGVISLIAYNSDITDRALSINATIQTEYGESQVAL